MLVNTQQLNNITWFLLIISYRTSLYIDLENYMIYSCIMLPVFYFMYSISLILVIFVWFCGISFLNVYAWYKLKHFRGLTLYSITFWCNLKMFNCMNSCNIFICNYFFLFLIGKRYITCVEYSNTPHLSTPTSANLELRCSLSPFLLLPPPLLRSFHHRLSLSYSTVQDLNTHGHILH